MLAGGSFAQSPEVAPSTEQHDVTDEDLVAFRLAVLEQIAEQGLASDASVYLASLSLSQDVAPLPPQLMQPDSSRIALPSSSTAANVFRGGAPRSNLPTDRAIASKASSSDKVLGIEARVRNTTDSGSLLESTTPGFTVLDLRTHWLVNNHLSFVSGIENITDKNYREHFDFRDANGLSVYQPGVNFYFGTELQY